jgi:hypothetical protein
MSSMETKLEIGVFGVFSEKILALHIWLHLLVAEYIMYISTSSESVLECFHPSINIASTR